MVDNVDGSTVFHNTDPLHSVASQNASEGGSVVGLLDVVRRRKLTIATFIAVPVVLGALACLLMTPQYMSSATLMLSPPERQIVGIQEVVGSLGRSPDVVETELQVLLSRSLSRLVVEELNLAALPEFNKELGTPSGIQGVIGWAADSMRTALGAISNDRNWSNTPEEPRERPGNELSKVIEQFRKRLSVHPIGKSRVLEISFLSQDPQLAADVPNLIVRSYIDGRMNEKSEETRKANLWISSQLATLRESLDAAERAKERFREEAGLVPGGRDVTLVLEQISDVSSQLVKAQGDRIKAEAHYERVRRVATDRRLEHAPEVLSSPVVQHLREQMTDVDRRRAAAERTRGSRHPEIIELRAQAAEINSMIGAEIQRIAASLQAEVATAQDREEALKQRLQSMREEVNEMNRRRVGLEALEREANVNRTIYEMFLTRDKETGMEGSLANADAKIVSPADIPAEPTIPNVPVVMALTLVLSASCGLLAAFLLEQLDQGFRGRQQIERLTGVRTVGIVPIVNRTSLFRRTRPHQFVLDSPRSAYAEALYTVYGRTIHDAIVDGQAPKSLIVTSSVPNEGKTTVATSLALLLASFGRKVCLVDADLRRPQIHNLMGVQCGPGLSDWLSGTYELEGVLRTGLASGVDILTSGRPVPNPSDVLSSSAMRAGLNQLCDLYDLVIVDTAPASVSADAASLSFIADRTLYLVRWGQTRRSVVTQMLQDTVSMTGTIPVVALSMVNVRRYAQYRFGDSGQYYGSAKAYFK